MNPIRIFGYGSIVQWIELRRGGEGRAYALNGSNISTLYDHGQLGWHETQATAATQPALLATSGPNSTPEADFQTASGDFLLSATGNNYVASGARPTMFAVGRAIADPATNGTMYFSLVDNSGLAGIMAVGSQDTSDVNRYLGQMNYVTAGADSVNFDAPATNGNDNLFQVAYTATTSQVRINDVLATINPASPGSGWTGGEASTGVDRTRSGGGATSSGGGLVSKVLLRVLETPNQLARLKTYYNKKFALTL